MKNFIKQHSVLFYFLLTCTISWLCLLSIIGIDGFLGRTTLWDESMPLLFMAMVAGPVISGLISIYVLDKLNRSRENDGFGIFAKPL